MYGTGSVLGTGFINKPKTLLWWHLLSILGRQTINACVVEQDKRIREQMETIKLFATTTKKVGKEDDIGEEDRVSSEEMTVLRPKRSKSKPRGFMNEFIYHCVTSYRKISVKQIISYSFSGLGIWE